MRVAGIDCGTNSIRLLIADVPGKDGALDDVARLMIVGLFPVLNALYPNFFITRGRPKQHKRWNAAFNKGIMVRTIKDLFVRHWVWNDIYAVCLCYIFEHCTQC